jgi:hypothetical protein
MNSHLSGKPQAAQANWDARKKRGGMYGDSLDPLQPVIFQTPIGNSLELASSASYF